MGCYESKTKTMPLETIIEDNYYTEYTPSYKTKRRPKTLYVKPLRESKKLNNLHSSALH